MAKKVSEHDALREIDLHLESLTDEERQRIFNFLVSKYKLEWKDSISTPGGSAHLPAAQKLPADITIKDFMSRKRPVGHYEKIACIAYYMEKYGKMDGFKTSDIVKGIASAKQIKLPNSAMYIKNTASQYGFLISAGGGMKALSARGEAVVDALPDREKVEKAMEEHPFKRNSSKKLKAKKK